MIARASGSGSAAHVQAGRPPPDASGDPGVRTAYTSNALNQYTRTDTDTDTPAVQRLTYDEDGNLTVAYVAGDMDCDGDLDARDLNLFTVLLVSGNSPPA